MKHWVLASALLATSGCGQDAEEKSPEEVRAESLVPTTPTPTGSASDLFLANKATLSLAGASEGLRFTVFRDVRTPASEESGRLTTRCVDRLDPEMVLGIIACAGDHGQRADLQVKHATQTCTVLDEVDAPSAEAPLAGSCEKGYDVYLNQFAPSLLLKFFGG